MNERFELWSLPWHSLLRRLAVELRPIAAPVDAAGETACLSPSWLARTRAPAQVFARRGP
jgi:hypothetical protein